MRYHDATMFFTWNHFASSRFMLWRWETPATPWSGSHFAHLDGAPTRPSKVESRRCARKRPNRFHLAVLVCWEANGFHWSMHMYAHIDIRRLQTRSDEDYRCTNGSVGCTIIWCSPMAHHRHHRDMVCTRWLHLIYHRFCLKHQVAVRRPNVAPFQIFTSR